MVSTGEICCWHTEHSEKYLLNYKVTNHLVCTFQRRDSGGGLSASSSHNTTMLYLFYFIQGVNKIPPSSDDRFTIIGSIQYQR